MKLKVLFVLGSGGHTTHSLNFARKIKDKTFFIVPWGATATKEIAEKKCFSVLSPRYRAKDNRVLSVFRTIFMFFQYLLILLRIRPDVIISTGPGIALFPMLISKMFRIRTVFIETPNRVYFPSITGKMLIGKVDLFLSSWIELSDRFEDVEYKGMLV
jgi:beta-1,4-N-acetylglucosaminyltransferase